MILRKKWTKHKVKSYIYWVNRFLREKRRKKWSQECKQKQSPLLNLCNIFYLLISRTAKIAWWPPVFRFDFTNFPLMNNSGKFKEISWTSLLYHTSLIRKMSLISKYLTSQPGQQTITIHIFSNISRSKGNQTLKFGQAIEYNNKYFSSKIMQKMRQGD